MGNQCPETPTTGNRRLQAHNVVRSCLQTHSRSALFSTQLQDVAIANSTARSRLLLDFNYIRPTGQLSE